MWWVVALGVAAALMGSAVGRASSARTWKPLSTAEVVRLNKLQPRVRALVLAMRARLNAAGLDCFLGDTMRTGAEERAHLAAGRSAISVSYHQSGRAADIYMKNARGRPDVAARDRRAYDAMHAAARAVGLQVFGFLSIRTPSGQTFTDPYHVQLPDGLDREAALARYQRGLDRSADGRVYS